jgi:hypothetical protein
MTPWYSYLGLGVKWKKMNNENLAFLTCSATLGKAQKLREFMILLLF